MSVEALIIHLTRAEKRRAHVDHLLASLPLDASIVDAVDGRALCDTDVASFYSPRLHRPIYPFALSRNEVACFLSHRKAWQTILDRNLEAALIMEDDAAPTASFASSLALGLSHIGTAGFIRFPFREGRERGRVIAEVDGVSLIEPVCVGLGMVAQLVSRTTAIQLLRATERIDRPVDTLLQMPWVTGVVPRSVVPGAISEISPALGGTTLPKNLGLLAKLKREGLRPVYRMKISIRSRLAKATGWRGAFIEEQGVPPIAGGQLPEAP